jgi:hypothetical protein
MRYLYIKNLPKNCITFETLCDCGFTWDLNPQKFPGRKKGGQITPHPEEGIYYRTGKLRAVYFRLL